MAPTCDQSSCWVYAMRTFAGSCPGFPPMWKQGPPMKSPTTLCSVRSTTLIAKNLRHRHDAHGRCPAVVVHVFDLHGPKTACEELVDPRGGRLLPVRGALRTKLAE